MRMTVEVSAVENGWVVRSKFVNFDGSRPAEGKDVWAFSDFESLSKWLKNNVVPLNQIAFEKGAQE